MGWPVPGSRCAKPPISPGNRQVTLTLNPAQPKAFAVHLRVPDRATSRLYTPTPAAEGLRSLSVNGPLIYNFESVDQGLDGVIGRTTPLATAWRSELLGGVQVIRGTFTDGEPWQVIPNYARLNRGGRSVVWMRSE